jgi:hypothetical protein
MILEKQLKLEKFIKPFHLLNILSVNILKRLIQQENIFLKSVEKVLNKVTLQYPKDTMV